MLILKALTKSLLRQKQMAKYSHFIGLGIAGNFALHLAQAGELEDFKDVITADEAAPKGMFPFYLPKLVANAKEMLYTYPLSSTTIHSPKDGQNIQIEPEVGLICELTYQNGKLSKVTPTHFGAYNDCSIRVAGASKISDKKNWGENSKGISDTLISIDKFTSGGVMDSYAICSFLKRDGEFFAYGEDVELMGYSYFHEKLLSWIVEQINSQEDFGPLEDIKRYISDAQNPTQAIISIGATRYTEYGEHTFLKPQDEIFVVVYNRNDNSSSTVLEALKNGSSLPSASVLSQEVV